jgi:NAD(P)H-nitrite reductase large subunit
MGFTTVEEIAREVKCTTGCGLCRPYIERMLETGETAFSVIPADEPSDTGL